MLGMATAGAWKSCGFLFYTLRWDTWTFQQELRGSSSLSSVNLERSSALADRTFL